VTPLKRPRVSPPESHIQETICENTADINDDPVTHWMRGIAMDPPLLKRKISSSSVGRKSEASDGSVRGCMNPAAKSRLYEKTLQAAGIYMGGGPGLPMLLELSASLCLRRNNLFLQIIYFETIDLKTPARGFVTKTKQRSSEIFLRSLFLLWKSYVPTAKPTWNPW
jgi:hypothetical protein